MASQKPFDTPPASIRSSSSSSSSSNHAVKNVVDAVKLVSAAQSASTTTTLPTDSSSKLPHSLSFSLNRKSKKSTKSHKTSAGPPVPFPAPAAPIHSYIPSKSSSTVTDDTATPSSNPDDETRPRYHSAISRSTISRSQSSSFAGKLQSLRKKIESELSRKRPGSNTNQQSNGGKRTSKRAQKGTVAGLRPSPALTVPEGMSVADASQLCAAKRADCVLVVDEEEGLSGIFTAKDLAFRVCFILVSEREK